MIKYGNIQCKIDKYKFLSNNDVYNNYDSMKNYFIQANIFTY